jgi:hypothetical protein
MVGLTFQPEETTLETLVEGFDVLGAHIQYWMPLAILMAAAAIVISVRWHAR